MRNISISGVMGTVMLSNDITFSVAPEPIETSTTMISGKVVIDTRGMRNTLETPLIWLTTEQLELLKRMIATERILTVTYPDVDGDRTEKMVFEMPTYRAFKFDENGVEYYYGVTLLARGQEVIQYSVTAEE